MRTDLVVQLFALLVVNTCCVRCNVNLRQLYARASPVRNTRVEVAPLTVQTLSSVTACVSRCLVTLGCRALNYGPTGRCELLGTFLCEGGLQLTAAPGVTYYDVESETMFKDIGSRDSKRSCQLLGQCSPKCPCEYTSTFLAEPGYYVAGFTKDTVIAESLSVCQQRCLEATTFLCKSADYSVSSQGCYLSHVTREDVPSAYGSGPYTYTYRTCE